MSSVAALPPTVNVCSRIVPTVVGALFACVFVAPTVTVNPCVAVALPVSVAVTVIVVDPSATAVIVNVAPDRLTVALVISEELAV